jgi:hypothetical protein
MSETSHAPSVDWTGQRVRFVRDVDRFPHFIARKGETGLYIGHRMGIDAVRLDSHKVGAEEWGNCVLWGDDEDVFIWDDVEPLVSIEIAKVELLVPNKPSNSALFGWGPWHALASERRTR